MEAYDELIPTELKILKDLYKNELQLMKKYSSPKEKERAKVKNHKCIKRLALIKKYKTPAVAYLENLENLGLITPLMSRSDVKIATDMPFQITRNGMRIADTYAHKRKLELQSITAKFYLDIVAIVISIIAIIISFIALTLEIVK